MSVPDAKRRRGKVVLVLGRACTAADPRPAPVGLATLAGALSDWRDLPAAAVHIVASRRRARDRRVPDVG